MTKRLKLIIAGSIGLFLIGGITLVTTNNNRNNSSRSEQSQTNSPDISSTEQNQPETTKAVQENSAAKVGDEAKNNEVPKKYTPNSEVQNEKKPVTALETNLENSVLQASKTFPPTCGEGGKVTAYELSDAARVTILNQTDPNAQSAVVTQKIEQFINGEIEPFAAEDIDDLENFSDEQYLDTFSSFELFYGSTLYCGGTERNPFTLAPYEITDGIYGFGLKETHGFFGVHDSTYLLYTATLTVENINDLRRHQSECNKLDLNQNQINLCIDQKLSEDEKYQQRIQRAIETNYQELTTSAYLN